MRDLTRFVLWKGRGKKNEIVSLLTLSFKTCCENSLTLL